MALENRNLKAGTKLAARYKGKVHTAEVVKTKDGIRYRLENGDEFKSPSSAGTAVMGGSACNGWRFWSLASDLKEKAEKKPAAKKRAKPVITPLEGEAKNGNNWWCSACMDGFHAPDDVTPLACPSGHKE